MKVICKKSLYLAESRYFTQGKEYLIIDDNTGPDGFSVVNDLNFEHWIFTPGNPFFDEYFELADEEPETNNDLLIAYQRGRADEHEAMGEKLNRILDEIAKIREEVTLRNRAAAKLY